MSAYKSMIAGYKQAGGKFYISRQFSSNHMLYYYIFIQHQCDIEFCKIILKRRWVNLDRKATQPINLHM